MDRSLQARSFGTNLRNKPKATQTLPHKPSAVAGTAAHQLSQKQKLERWKRRKEAASSRFVILKIFVDN
jgi:hypothetical protein